MIDHTREVSINLRNILLLKDNENALELKNRMIISGICTIQILKN